MQIKYLHIFWSVWSIFFCENFVHAQLTLTPDTVVCKGASIDLHAYVTGATNTSHYTIQNTSFAWELPASSTTFSNMLDDDVRGPINIGFTFSFFCADYTQLYVSSNGWVSFGTANTISWDIRKIPNTNFYVPKNAILAPWEDWNPALGGTVSYGIKGSAPYRKFIISWQSVPMFACPNLTGTFQIVLEETTNNIQNNILYKPLNGSCNSTTGLNATQGIQNMAGTLAFAVPGRNDTLWTIYDNSIKYIPGVDTTNIVWSQAFRNQPLIQTWYGKTITVTPDTFSTYTASLKKCDGSYVNASISVGVISAMTSTLINRDTSVCSGVPVNLSVSVTGGKPSNYRFFWVNDNELKTTGNFTTHPTATEKYQVIVSDYCSLPDTHSVNIFVYPPLKFVSVNDTSICYGTSVDIKPTTSGGIDSLRYIDWGNFIGNEKIFYPLQDTVLHLLLKDNCTINPDSATIHINVKPPLSIKTINDTTLCFGDTLKLKTFSSGGDSLHYHYTWNNGIGDFASINFVPDSSHNYKVILSDGCTPKTDSANTTVRVRRTPKILMLTDTTICKGQSITLFAMPVKGDTDGVTFLWDNGIGLNNNINIYPDTTTKFIVKLNDICLTVPETDSVTVSVRPPLSVSVRDTLICYGNVFNLVSIGTGGNKSTYQFKWNTGATGDTLFNISPKTKTTFQVILSDNCTTLSDTANVTVDVLAPLTIKLPSDTILCEGSLLNILAQPSGGTGTFKYKWNGINSNDSFEMIKVVNDILLIVQLTDGCSIPAKDTMQIISQPIPKADFTIDQISNCGLAQINFNNNSTYSTGSIFKWDFNDGTFSSDSNNTIHKYSANGNYNVKLSIISTIGCADSISKSISVFLRKAAFANFTASSFDVDITNPTIDFISLSADTLKHNWIFGQSGITSTSMFPVVTFKDTGNYLTTLIVKNIAGCRDTMSKWVRVDDVFNLFVPNSFTPNNDGLNDIFLPIGRGIKSYNLTIFERGGNVIFETDDLKNGWNGHFQNGNDLNSGGVVFYKITTVDIFDRSHEKYGTITVLK